MEVVPAAVNTNNVPTKAFSVLKMILPFFLSIFICKYTISQNNAAALANDTALALLTLLVIFLKPNSLFIIHMSAFTYYYTVFIGL